MKVIVLLAAVTTTASSAFAGHNADSTIWSGPKGGLCDSAWVVTFPTGPSDYFDQTFTVNPGSSVALNTENGDLNGVLPFTGVSVSVADFGSGRNYPLVGVFASNLVLDPSGETPDLSSAIVSLF